MAFEGMEPLAQRLFEEVRAALVTQQTHPLSTYRLQIHSGFTLEDARALVPYLAKLGVSHLYTSPLMAAAPGSVHGYDVIDHSRLNPEVGDEAALEALAKELRAHRMGLVLDTVPNHMGIEKGQNPLWNDVLENGPASIYARYFDIDWDPVKDELRNKVLLPILGDQYGVVLENGELQLHHEDGAFSLRYYDHRFPIAPREYATVLRHRLEVLERELGPEDLDFVELLSIITAVEHLPSPSTLDRARILERNREKEVVKRRLAALAERSEAIGAFIETNVSRFNGRKGEPHTFDLLDRILSNCSYRLAHWRVAGEEINYRRFFDINGLAAIRTEDREVFDEAHALVFRWIDEGKVQGLRIDHPDGLFDPTAYFLRLQEEYFLLEVRRRRPEHPRGDELRERQWLDVEDRIRQRFRDEFDRDPESPLFRSLYVVVEKIQGGRERIPDAWAVHGTTGYRFANSVTGLFVQREHEKAFTRIYERFIGRQISFADLVYEKKKLIMSASMSSEINVLARELNRISEMNRRTRDFTLNALRRGLVEFIAQFPVYRTYVDAWREIDARDVEYIRWTIARSKERDSTTSGTLYDFLEEILLRKHAPETTEHQREVMLRFAMKLQQLTGPVMAKGLEDTAFYVYNRLVALNEVGGEPQHFGISVDYFHLRNQERAMKWPSALLASSTHDTKRSEDVRARLAVLSEVPEEWKEHLRRWTRLNRRFKARVRNGLGPDNNDEYLFYQAVIGAWPMGDRHTHSELESFRARVRDYMLKAVREAKVNTSWVNPDPTYEDAVRSFVERALDPKNTAFLESAESFKRRLERAGQLNSLSGTLLKLASPGTPDIYQGCELWDLSLVDPDNRRPVDFAERLRALEELERDGERDREELSRRLVDSIWNGRIKLYLISQTLKLRNARPKLFREGHYLPLDLIGPRANHALGMARQLGEQWMVAVAPRMVVPLVDSPGGLAASFEGTTLRLPRELEGAQLRNLFTGRTFTPDRDEGGPVIDLSKLLGAFPVALLETVNV